ncbi:MULTISPECIES: hypothetical protein [unclassified Methanobrevibacter]|uniref:hypothetical protein n=1 Tax=unclassified Methanobrevibacter TaxID=2638681 RepID=UPI0027361D08|nr:MULTISPECIES: hypothetical protein [unclassified Methanobrevibacter]
MNKMVVFFIKHPNHPDVSIKGLIDGDYLLDEEAMQYAGGIIQYYQGDNLRWDFPVNPFMKNSIKWNDFEELKGIISRDEKSFAFMVFEGDENVSNFGNDEMIIEREVITW